MRKATAVYHAPEGDEKVVEMGGVTFFDGHSVELNSNDHGEMIDKLVNNQHFEIEVGEDDAPAEKPRRGRPPGGVKTGIEKAAFTDFEKKPDISEDQDEE